MKNEPNGNPQTDQKKFQEDEMQSGQKYFHLHLISDATGETLLTVARAASAQYPDTDSIEHIYPLVRNIQQLEHIFSEIKQSPGIVLYTLVDPELAIIVETHCRKYSIPNVSILDPILSLFHSYLGKPTSKRIGAQHALDADYFKRIDALDFTMMHDDGQLPEDINEAEIIIIGISRTSKTPTSIYLANRGIKTTNIPIIPSIPIPEALFKANNPLIVGLIASSDRIIQIRQNRLLSLNVEKTESSYINRSNVAEEIAFTRKLCKQNSWPIIDVTRRSIEETAAAIITLYQNK